ncbi:MAG: AMP-binding protein [Verrucomicrobiota bacterium]
MAPSRFLDDAFWNSQEPFIAAPPEELPDVPSGIPELAGHVLFRTSGTTGKPKWVVLSKPALLASAAAINAHLMVTADSVWGLALPVHHVGGFGVVVRTRQAGCALKIFTQRWQPADFRAWLEHNGVSHLSLVPTQVHDLVTAGLTAPGCLQAIVVGGGLLDEATGRAARGLGWPVLASYGLTEAASQVATQPLAALQSTYSSWPVPLLPHWQTRLDANDCLEIHGPALFSGYWSDGNWVPTDPWFRTKDRAQLAARSLTVFGRADTLVKILGELVDPFEIEHEITSLAAGKIPPASFVVIPLPDVRRGCKLVAAFDGEPPEDVITAYQASAPGFKRLADALELAPFPRSALGKPLRGEIAAAITRRFE